MLDSVKVYVIMWEDYDEAWIEGDVFYIDKSDAEEEAKILNKDKLFGDGNYNIVELANTKDRKNGN